LAEIFLEKGQLHQATAIYEEALALAAEPSSRNICDMGPVEAGLALIKYEQNDLTTAHHLAINGVRHSSSPNQYVFTYEILARILLAQDDFLGSLEAINQVDKIKRSYPVLKMLVSSTEQTRVRTWIAQDDTLAIEQWLAEYQESAITDEILSLTLARIYMYQNKLDEALSLLNHLGYQVISDQRKNMLIETLVLQSVVLLKQDQIGLALEKLENSLDMAAPQGYVRVYVDAGLPMLHLLLTARSREIHADYIHHLLTAFPGVKPEQIVKPQIQNSEFDWLEPLSNRESEVLQLLAKGLTNQAIADRLVLSIHTVKTHTRSIYSKLAVNNRTQAVDRARTLGVLPQN
jgi:LuxR family maltose regulon positive regulatory protein